MYIHYTHIYGYVRLRFQVSVRIAGTTMDSRNDVSEELAQVPISNPTEDDPAQMIRR